MGLTLEEAKSNWEWYLELNACEETGDVDLCDWDCYWEEHDKYWPSTDAELQALADFEAEFFGWVDVTVEAAKNTDGTHYCDTEVPEWDYWWCFDEWSACHLWAGNDSGQCKDWFLQNLDFELDCKNRLEGDHCTDEEWDANYDACFPYYPADLDLAGWADFDAWLTVHHETRASGEIFYSLARTKVHSRSKAHIKNLNKSHSKNKCRR